MPSVINCTTTNGLVTSADNSGSLQLQTNNGTTAVTIDTSQNVGIGTSSPASSLDVRATDGRSILRLTANTATNPVYQRFSNTGGFCYVGMDGSGGSDFGAGAYATGLWSTGAYPTVFGTNGTERMRITSGGDLLVGTTTAQGKVTVNQTANSPTAHLTNSNASFTDSALIIYNTRTTTNSTYNHLACFNGNFSGQFIVRDSGNAVNTNNSYGAVSDIKLKENIVDATPKLADLCKVKVRQYNLKSDPSHKQIGVVAQELEEVFAGLIEETVDKDKEGNDLRTTTKSVKYSVFVPMLIKAIQELNTDLANTKLLLTEVSNKVEAQAARIAELEGAK